LSRSAGRKIQEFLGDRFILVVEPRPNYRTSIKQFLSNLKIKNVKIVAGVPEARSELLTLHAGMIIAEWSMTVTNGLQFCRELRKDPKFDDAPFLLLSVENLKRDVVLASEVGVDAYLLKPFSFEDFRDQLELLATDWQAPSQLTKLLLAAEKYFAAGDLSAAESFYEDARQKFPGSARAVVGLGQIAESRGDQRKAISLFELASVINPTYLDALKHILRIYESERNIHGVLNVGNKLHELSPDNPRYTLLLAMNHLNLKDYEKSEEFFRKTVRLSPKIAEAWRGLGNVYMLQEDYERAMKNFHKALDLDGTDVSTLNSLGLLYVRQGKFKEGVNMYRIALRVDPNDPRILFNLGHAFERSGDTDQARHCYNQALITDPHFDKAKRGVERLDAAGRKVS
jgi:tetratricopeptide (TPR) repeat protein